MALGPFARGGRRCDPGRTVRARAPSLARRPVGRPELQSRVHRPDHQWFRALAAPAPTGGGADLCDIMQRNWSEKIVRIGFGEAPSDDPCSHEDIRPASDVYKNRRAEMYFRSANAVKSGQLKGIDKDTAQELVTIEFGDSKPKIVLMKKEDYKKKFGKSPDYADTAIMLVELARRLGFRLAAIGQTINRGVDFSKTLNKVQDVYTNVDYSPEEQYEPI